MKHSALGLLKVKFRYVSMLNGSHSYDTTVVTQWDAAPQTYTQPVP
jgi:hypothetical protein